MEQDNQTPNQQSYFYNSQLTQQQQQFAAQQQPMQPLYYNQNNMNGVAQEYQQHQQNLHAQNFAQQTGSNPKLLQGQPQGDQNTNKSAPAQQQSSYNNINPSASNALLDKDNISQFAQLSQMQQLQLRNQMPLGQPQQSLSQGQVNQLGQAPPQVNALLNQYNQSVQRQNKTTDPAEMQMIQRHLLQQMQGLQQQQAQAQGAKHIFNLNGQGQQKLPMQGNQQQAAAQINNPSEQAQKLATSSAAAGIEHHQGLGSGHLGANFQKWIGQPGKTIDPTQQNQFNQLLHTMQQDQKNPNNLIQYQQMANQLQERGSVPLNLLQNQNFTGAHSIITGAQSQQPNNPQQPFAVNGSQYGQFGGGYMVGGNDRQDQASRSQQLEFELSKFQQKSTQPETQLDSVVAPSSAMYFVPQQSNVNSVKPGFIIQQNQNVTPGQQQSLQQQSVAQQPNTSSLQNQQFANFSRQQQLNQPSGNPAQPSQQMLVKPNQDVQQQSNTNIHFQNMFQQQNQSSLKPQTQQLQHSQIYNNPLSTQQQQNKQQVQPLQQPQSQLLMQMPMSQNNIRQQNQQANLTTGLPNEQTQPNTLFAFQQQQNANQMTPGLQNVAQLQSLQNENSTITTFQNYSKMAEYYGTKGDYVSAIQYYMKMTEIDPENGPSWAAIGHCYLLSNDINKAFNAYQQALYCLEDIRDPQLWYGIGILYEKFESYDHAISALIAVLKMSPNFQQKSELLYKLGVILAKTNQLDQAVRYFQNSILASNFSMKRRVDTQLKIGILYELQGDFVQAQNSYEVAKSHNQNYHKVYQHLAWCSFQQGQIIEALDQIEKADSKSKDNLDSLYIKGRCYLLMSRFQEAHDCFQAVKQKSPTDAIFWTSFAIFLFLQNKFTESFEAIIKASTLKPDLVEIWYNLGILYEKCNQPEEANIAFQKVLELQPGHTDTLARIMILNGGAEQDDRTLVMKHPFYCVSNSLVILRKYWSQDSYERCIQIQNQLPQQVNLDHLHNFDQAIDIESVQRSNYQNDPNAYGANLQNDLQQHKNFKKQPQEDQQQLLLQQQIAQQGEQPTFQQQLQLQQQKYQQESAQNNMMQVKDLHQFMMQNPQAQALWNNIPANNFQNVNQSINKNLVSANMGGVQQQQLQQQLQFQQTQQQNLLAQAPITTIQGLNLQANPGQSVSQTNPLVNTTQQTDKDKIIEELYSKNPAFFEQHAFQLQSANQAGLQLLQDQQQNEQQYDAEAVQNFQLQQQSQLPFDPHQQNTTQLLQMLQQNAATSAQQQQAKLLVQQQQVRNMQQINKTPQQFTFTPSDLARHNFLSQQQLQSNSVPSNIAGQSTEIQIQNKQSEAGASDVKKEQFLPVVQSDNQSIPKEQQQLSLPASNPENQQKEEGSKDKLLENVPKIVVPNEIDYYQLYQQHQLAQQQQQQQNFKMQNQSGVKQQIENAEQQQQQLQQNKLFFNSLMQLNQQQMPGLNAQTPVNQAIQQQQLQNEDKMNFDLQQVNDQHQQLHAQQQPLQQKNNQVSSQLLSIALAKMQQQQQQQQESNTEQQKDDSESSVSNQTQ